jgi:DNA topoisomerase-1
LYRRRRGRGFSYTDPSGRPVTDPAVLARIRALAIPPAWKDVWICPWPHGHIQATGVDARGRTQYRYHDQWRVQRDRAKFDHMLDFARALPRLRQAVDSDLQGTGLGEARVLAGAARLLDVGFFRIGSDCYAEENQTYGLTTLLRSHVQVDGESVVFDFPAKGGKRRLQAIVDDDVRDLISALRRQRGGGDALLVWKRSGGRGDQKWVDVDSDAVNAYVKDRAGVDCSAKDFRTWNATVLAAVALSVSTRASSPTARQRCVARAMTEVAHYLGNTPAVVRRSYVDPRVVDRFHSGLTIAAAISHLGVELGQVATRGMVEEAVVDLLAGGDADDEVTAA